MQFHLNGFKPGDPAKSNATKRDDGPESSDQLPSEVDVLIIGCGPTGLTLAAQLAQFPEIKVRIVDQKSGPLLLGQADGIACRTMEMFEAFGFSERVLKEAYWVNETAFWKPDEQCREKIVRHGRIQDTEDGLSEFPHVILNQARIHDFFLDVMRNAPAALEPDYSRRLVDLQIDPTDVPSNKLNHIDIYPVTVRLERLDPRHESQQETVKARFVVGCDGAHSAVRKVLGTPLRGDSANHAWGVMDVLAVSDFPDIRLKAVIHSANEGNVLVIPREGGYLVRLYIELDKLKEHERISHRNISVDDLIASAQRILQPYTLEVKEVVWWSVYEIGQRLCDKFDDVPDEHLSTRIPRVLIAGDACHTHSPKAGQGMNVSMADAFNLGWKLASVLLGRSSPQILHTYSEERRTVAKTLIDFDREFAAMFSARPKDPLDRDSEGVDPADFQRYFIKQGRFTAGTAVQYNPSRLIATPAHQNLAQGLSIGMRFHSAPAVRLSDAKPIHLGHTVKADGRWRIFAFDSKKNPGGPSSDLRELCDFFSESPQSPVRRYTPPGADVDSVIDVRAIFQHNHRVLDVESMPPLLLPEKGRYRLRDYEKVFCADLKSGQDIFELRGIDRDHGCLVIVRPDQYVAQILSLDDYSSITAFFEGFMLAPDRNP